MVDSDHVRRLHPADAAPVRALFRATAALGRPLALPEADLVAYEALCLDFHLQHADGASAVLVEDGVVVGYALVALDHAAQQRWTRGQALRWARRGVRRSLGRSTGDSRTFHRLRLWDGVVTLATGVPAPMPASIHVNVAAASRGVRGGLDLAAAADAAVQSAGLPGWFGEVNVPLSRPGRALALHRLGGRVVHRQRNRTMSWLAGEPVDRLTVVRSVDPVHGWVPLSRPMPSGAG